MRGYVKQGALAPLRVLDLSQARAGPVCAMHLAGFGAEVLKIETPIGAAREELYVGERDGADMQNLHRNKRSITLDLKSDGGREVMHRLVATSDVVVENFRPDVKRRLGLDYESLNRINGRIILASISGFGQNGPYGNRPGFDQILQGMCGLMSTTGDPSGEPTRAGAAVIDVGAGLYAAIGILAALFEREHSGRGQWVQTSLLSTGINLMDFQAARYLADGVVAGRVGNDHPTNMPTSAYRTGDGYLNIGAGSEAMWVRLCEALGDPDMATAPKFHKNADRVANRQELNERISVLLQTRTAAEWVDKLLAADVPCGPVYTMDQVFNDPQVKHIGIAKPMLHPRRGKLHVVGQAVEMSRTPPTVTAPLEDRGESTEAILKELGYASGEIHSLRVAGVI